MKERNVGFNLAPALLTGRVDAVLGAFWNYEGTELRMRGRRPQIIRMDEAGVPTYDELVLVANEDALERDGDKIRAFIGALSRGTRDLRRDPDEAIDGLLDANPDLDPKLQRAVVKVTLPLFLPPRGQPVRLPGFGQVGRLRRLDARQRAAGEHTGPGRRARQRACCRGRGCEAPALALLGRRAGGARRLRRRRRLRRPGARATCSKRGFATDVRHAASSSLDAPSSG